jgi:hypothetical protein
VGVDLDDAMRKLDKGLPESFAVECEHSARTADLWLSWLDAVEREPALDYTPTHILIASRTHEDWTDPAFTAATDLLLSANRIACNLSD